MPDVTDIALAREFAASHSEPAFAELVRRHINLVYSVAWRYVGNAQDAQDVTQAVFLILARKAARLRGHAVLTGWLYETTRFTALRFLRAKIRRQFREQEAYMQSTPNESDADNVWRQLAPLLEEAMTRLNEKERTLLALRFFENRTGAETAALLGIEEWAGRKRANRALEKLRKFFTQRGVTLSTTAIVGAVSANSVHAAPAGLAKMISAVAITKGAAAGSSTLALVKGALKLMAWTKAKTAVVVTLGLLLAAGTTAVVTESLTRSEKNDAIWNDNGKALDAAPPMVILRPTKFSESRAGGILLPDGKLAIRCQSAKELLVHAFNWSPVKMIVNTQLPTGRFDYLVTLPENQKEALQGKIHEQLHIVGRHEMRDMPVYIVRGTPAPELKKLGSSEQVEQVVENGHYKGPISAMWYTLEYYLKTPVLPEMAETLDCAVDFWWGKPKDRAFPDIPDVAALKNALHDQLGLELIATNQLVEMLVIEKAK